MKSFTALMSIAWMAAALCGCSPSNHAVVDEDPTVIEIKGTVAAPVQGYYIRNGKRIGLPGVLPITICEPGVSQVAVRKVNAQDNLTVSAQRPGMYGGYSIPPGVADGVLVNLAQGFSASVLTPQESLAVPPENSLMVIAPYWYEGTWVFDDPKMGLVREPFVRGVPEMINVLVSDILDAKSGFRMTFSAKPFPGWQKKLVWVRAADGGNYYRLEDGSMEGWSCPALYKYFSEAPKEIYVRAEPKMR
ncbi:MAG: DUF6717 family protein [Bacillota bacterium]